jgi:thiamine-monophosphate kinase
MNEQELISTFVGAQHVRRPDVVLGIGDDGAVTQVPTGCELVIVTDTLSEGTHFPKGTPADALGYRCLAVNLSDLAAMGAKPLWASLSLSLPVADSQWISDFTRGFFRLAEEFEVELVGGDTVNGPLVVTVTLHGCVRRGHSISRSGAVAGQRIYVTGWLGEAAAGCRALLNEPVSADGVTKRLVDAFLYPQPRVREALDLVGLATAMIDLSDGLYTDLQRMLDSSSTGAVVDVGRINLSPALRSQSGETEALQLALTGGDDYEICFIVPADRAKGVEEIARAWSCPLVYLGDTTVERGVCWLRSGSKFDMPDTTYEHF